MAETRGLEPHPVGPSAFKAAPTPRRLRFRLFVEEGRALEAHPIGRTVFETGLAPRQFTFRGWSPRNRTSPVGFGVRLASLGTLGRFVVCVWFFYQGPFLPAKVFVVVFNLSDKGNNLSRDRIDRPFVRSVE